MRVVGFAGWSRAGKTTLIVRLIPELLRRGLSVSTIKHTHHAFDVDTPARIPSSIARQARMRCWRRRLPASRSCGSCAARASLRSPSFCACWRRSTSFSSKASSAKPSKIEVYRASLGKPRLQLLDPDIVALVGDPLPSALLPHAHVDDIAAVAALVLAHAAPPESLPERLTRDHG